VNKATIAALSMTMTLAFSAPARAQADPPPPELEFVFEELVTLDAAIRVGETPLGTRTIIPITGGTFEGPEIAGTIIPGGWDWQLLRADGCTELVADYMIRTDDGVIINVINEGVVCPPRDGEPSPVRTHPKFEAPIGKYDWLNRGTFIGALVVAGDAEGPAVRIRFYRVLRALALFPGIRQKRTTTLPTCWLLSRKRFASGSDSSPSKVRAITGVS
jgi:hypothetical protein